MMWKLFLWCGSYFCYLEAFLMTWQDIFVTFLRYDGSYSVLFKSKFARGQRCRSRQKQESIKIKNKASSDVSFIFIGWHGADATVRWHDDDIARAKNFFVSAANNNWWTTGRSVFFEYLTMYSCNDSRTHYWLEQNHCETSPAGGRRGHTKFNTLGSSSNL